MSSTESTTPFLARLLAAAIALSALTGVSIAAAGAASAAPGSNSGNAKLCEDWPQLFREDGSTFQDRGDCTKYAARGGTIRTTPPPPPVDPTPNVVQVLGGAAAGTYAATSAEFGLALTSDGVTGSLSLVNDGAGEATDGCSALIGFPAGGIAVMDRGACDFVQQVQNAQNEGAVAVVIVNNVAGAPITLTGDAPADTIPSVMVSQADGSVIKAGLPATGIVAAAG